MRILLVIVLAVILVSSLEANNVNGKRNRQALTRENVAEQLRYYVYTRENRNKAEIIQADVESVIRNIYNPLKPTTIAIHRWQGNKDSAENKAIVDAKLDLEDCNVIIVDWSAIASNENYDEVVEDAPAVGAAIADFIIILNRHFDVRLQQFHLVGFSVGAQIAGFAGKSVHAQIVQKVARITALDPAAASYEGTTELEHLAASDAIFVDVIHTNAGGLGYQQPCGHADYYPNGGAAQPNCNAENLLCSHIRAYELVKEMWSRQNEFISARCANLNLENCVWVNVKMGENIAKTGLYYLETNGVYPYGKGSFAVTFL